MEVLVVDVPVRADGQVQRFGQRVDNRRADPVQAARDLVPAAAELAAGVQDGVGDGRRRNPLFRVDAGGDAAAVVLDPDDVPRQDIDLDPGTVPRQSLVDRVVDDLLDQMVQAGQAGRADIHTRALADRFQPFQHLDLRFIVVVFFRLFKEPFESLSFV